MDTQALATRKSSAPGPDVVPYEVVGLIGKETAGVMATALTDWCADMGTQDLPQIWAQSILSLIPKAGEGGWIRNLRPIGLVSVIQKTVAACIMRKTRPDLLKGSVNAHAATHIDQAAVSRRRSCPCVFWSKRHMRGGETHSRG